MARFEDFGVSKGWWFYFELRCASGTPEFLVDFKEELLKLITEDEGSFIVYGENNKVEKRVQVRSVRS